jgi:hypothetical protein
MLLATAGIQTENAHSSQLTAPVKYVPTDFKKKEQQKDTLLWPHVILFASIMIVLFISLISVEDTVLRSSLTDQAVGIENIFPENPSEVFYDFLFGTNSFLFL